VLPKHAVAGSSPVARSRVTLWLCCLLAMAGPLPGRDARAEHKRARLELPPYELAYDLKIDLPVTLIPGVILGVTNFLKDRTGPFTCRWCDTRDSLNAFDRSAFETMSHAACRPASTASDMLAFVAAPLVMLAIDLGSNYDGRARPGLHWAKRFGVDVLIVLEAAIAAQAIDQLAKFAVARRRPAAIDEPASATREVEENLSFFSGHSTLAFSLTAAAATCLSLRGQRLAPLAWTLGMAIATTTSMLRVGAGRHFASDVLVGALVGSAVGVTVPLAHRDRMPISVGGQASADRGVLSVAGRF
jgi:membrane-associated phospholipid phosphatase